jgi:hypothetical protein
MPLELRGIQLIDGWHFLQVEWHQTDDGAQHSANHATAKARRRRTNRLDLLGVQRCLC